MEKYQVVHCLSSALYGNILLCEEKETKTHVIIKRLHLQHALQHRTLQGIPVREDALMERRIHRLVTIEKLPHVLPLQEDFVEDGYLHFVMKYCSAGDLFALVTKKIPLCRIQRYFKHICTGVAAFHQAGLAHRDLSLENVLVDEQDVCFISDFGLVTSAKPQKCELVGKAFYIAPELYVHVMYEPQAADIWSLGVLLFIMLTGHPLVQQANNHDSGFHLLETKGLPALLTQWSITLHPSIVKLLEGMLAIQPRDRWTIDQIQRFPVRWHSNRWIHWTKWFGTRTA